MVSKMGYGTMHTCNRARKGVAREAVLRDFDHQHPNHDSRLTAGIAAEIGSRVLHDNAQDEHRISLRGRRLRSEEHTSELQSH